VHIFSSENALKLTNGNPELKIFSGEVPGRSQMNLYHTSSRNRLLTETVGDLMMVGVNGPPITHWNATKYVVSWLQSGKHGALDKPRGIAKKEVEVPKSYQLFA
jgi:hypothetical protein